jgi:hypothetical protein
LFPLQLSLPVDVHEGQEGDADRASNAADYVTVGEVPKANATLDCANNP